MTTNDLLDSLPKARLVPQSAVSLIDDIAASREGRELIPITDVTIELPSYMKRIPSAVAGPASELETLGSSITAANDVDTLWGKKQEPKKKTTRRRS